MNLPVDSATASQSSAALEEGLRVASHEIRQPVAAVLALAEAARLHPEATPAVQQYLERIVVQASHISETARSVLEVENHRPPQRIIVDVDDVVDETLESFRMTWSGTIVRSGDRGLFALGDPALLRRCLVNVVENATRAAGAQGSVAVDLRREGDQVVAQVDDDGPGFGNVSSRSHMGLSLTRRALSGMGGALRLSASPTTGGARVVLVVPLLDAAQLRPRCAARAV